MAKEAIEKAAGAASGTPVEAKLVEMLDSLQNGAVTIGDQIVRYSPDVAEAALWVVRVDGIQSVFQGIVSLVVAVIGYRLWLRLAKWAKETRNLDELEFWIPTIVGSGPVFICISTFYKTILNVWVWVAIFEPKLYLAKQIISAALGK